MKVLELYSGIGGMHMALQQAFGDEGEIKASIDINPVANKIYKYNFPRVNLLERNIQGLTTNFINNLNVDTILMSPPCQPFTRNGLQKDIHDERTNSFEHILSILPSLKVTKILLENVKGFENSTMRQLLITTLKNCDFIYQEFILNPNQFGVPNSRNRYYCIARKSPQKFNFEVNCDEIFYNLPNLNKDNKSFPIGDIVEDDLNFDDYRLKDKILEKHAKILDICYMDSTNSMCFTKAYGRYIEGTGSVFTDVSREVVYSTFKDFDNILDNIENFRRLNLRFFTPKEVCRLMCFPEKFNFPSDITKKQKYMVLGNSINVKVVSELIKLLK